jgi:hypothetical protein
MDEVDTPSFFQVNSYPENANVIRRLQSHAAFVSLCFNIRRRSYNNSKVYIQTTWNIWPKTRALLEKLTSEEFLEAAEQARQYRPITNPVVKELLKAITRVGVTSAGSNEKKSHMLVELKSSVVYHGCPIIFVTLFPGDLHSPISLYYAGEKIGPKHFLPQWYTASYRLKIMLRNPLAVVEYFHTLINTIIEAVFKKGIFGDLRHYYGTIEYQGRGTPHLHMTV